MKPRLAYPLLFIVSYLLIVIAFFPADRALGLINEQLGEAQKIDMAHIEGRAWQGRSQSLQANGIHLEDLQWTLHPLSLLLGEFSFTLNSHYQGHPEKLTVTRESEQRFTFNDVAIQWPLSPIKAPIPRVFQPSGLIHLDLDTALIDTATQRLDNVQGHGQWTQAMFGNATLGEFSVAIKTSNQTITGIISSHKDNTLQASGQFNLKKDGSYRLDLTLTPTADIDPILRRNLSLLGRISPDGSLPLHMEGNIEQLKALLASTN